MELNPVHCRCVANIPGPRECGHWKRSFVGSTGHYDYGSLEIITIGYSIQHIRAIMRNFSTICRSMTMFLRI